MVLHATPKAWMREWGFPGSRAIYSFTLWNKLCHSIMMPVGFVTTLPSLTCFCIIRRRDVHEYTEWTQIGLVKTLQIAIFLCWVRSWENQEDLPSTSHQRIPLPLSESILIFSISPITMLKVLEDISREYLSCFWITNARKRAGIRMWGARGKECLFK